MVEKLAGSWKLCGGDSPDEYLQAVGFGAFLRTIASRATPTVSIDINGEGATINTTVAVLSFKTEAKFGEEFDEEPPDNQKCRSLLYVNRDVLYQVRRWLDKKTVIKRYVDNEDNMIMELYIGKIKCRRIFERIS
ncbi:fatty acid-binding protein 9-like [Clavelina lepadiformis]|uniref:Uncharacterized protein n=1 Tax=Clavelina lepadiformis TaxID=159417 RepID=A0ABP0FCA9_CLALP